MLRNSTQQFKQKYPSSFKTLHTYTLHYQKPVKLFQTIKTQRFIGNMASSKKLQTNFGGKEKNNFIRTSLSIKTQAIEQREIKYRKVSEVIQFQPQSSCNSIKFADMKVEPLDSTILEKNKNDTVFIDKLPTNCVFYCCQCFQYVFQIEKKRHYPECKDRITPADRKTDHFSKTAWQRLQKIVELSEYTQQKTHQIKQLYKEVTKHQYNRLYRINYPQFSRFFSLQEIVQAFTFTYQKLLKGTVCQDEKLMVCF